MQPKKLKDGTPAFLSSLYWLKAKSRITVAAAAAAPKPHVGVVEIISPVLLTVRSSQHAISRGVHSFGQEGWLHNRGRGDGFEAETHYAQSLICYKFIQVDDKLKMCTIKTSRSRIMFI